MARILVVDDDPTILELIKVTLTVKGYIVYTASDAHMGLNIMLKEQPDLAIIDYLMPDRDGLSLLKDIRSIPEFKNTPIIMLTGSGAPDIVSKAIQNGVSDYVVKPFKVLLLLKRVEKYLAQQDG